jgi:hypothetical protein
MTSAYRLLDVDHCSIREQRREILRHSSAMPHRTEKKRKDKEDELAIYLNAPAKTEDRISTLYYSQKHHAKYVYIHNSCQKSDKKIIRNEKGRALYPSGEGKAGIVYAPLVCRLENLVLLFALIKLLLPPLASVSPLPLTSPLLPAVNVLPFLVATRPSSLLFSTTS